MNIEQVNYVLTQAIMQFQDDEIEGMLESPKLALKWKKEKISLDLPDDTLVNAYSKGVWAIHRSSTGSGWSLTHIPSGLAAFQNVSSDKFLKNFVDVIVDKKPELLRIKNKNELQKYAVFFSEIYADLKAYK
jgi:hypothetical protein